MGLFTKRDRIAIAIITTLIVVGWGWRYVSYKTQDSGEVRVLKGAIPVPSALNAPNQYAAEFPGIDAKVNINTAGRDDFESLPGIGPKKAAAVLEYRDQNGPFASPDDLLNVNGIGPVTLDRIKNLITISADSTSQK